jgi:hypothetical protein
VRPGRDFTDEHEPNVPTGKDPDQLEGPEPRAGHARKTLEALTGRRAEQRPNLLADPGPLTAFRESTLGRQDGPAHPQDAGQRVYPRDDVPGLDPGDRRLEYPGNLSELALRESCPPSRSPYSISK